MTLGTILPDLKQLAKAEAITDKLARQRELSGDCQFAGCDKRVVGGEVRYYESATRYAIVARSGKVLRFEVTPDGDKTIFPNIKK